MIPSHFTTEIGRMRTEEMIARAEQYRRVQRARRHTKPTPPQHVSRGSWALYRRALAIVGLSVVIVALLVAPALAAPVGPGSSDGGSGLPPRIEHGLSGAPSGSVELPAIGRVEPEPVGSTTGDESSDSSWPLIGMTGALAVLLAGTATVVVTRRTRHSIA